MSSLERRIAGAAAVLVACLGLLTSANAQRYFPRVPPIVRYNAIAESVYILNKCGELTAARREWLEHLRGHAMRGLDWSAAQWAAHDAALAREHAQTIPYVPKDRCDEYARTTDHERRTIPRS